MAVGIVTGASRGLGRALAKELVARGWRLVIDARTAAELDEAAAALGPAVTPLPGDVTDPIHRRHLVGAAEALGGVDLLVNNASLLGPSPQPRLVDYPLDVLDDVYRVNVLAPLALVQESLPALRRTHGVVVNVTSDAGVEAYAGWGGYGSSKAALDHLGRILAEEEPDVAVYTVDPGDMNTRMHQEAFPGEDISDRPPPEVSVPGIVALIERRPPSGRYVAREVEP
jgi:NAD(P)-dependent dehydrogenase (short-subunit alcohol dehydrogenase family)